MLLYAPCSYSLSYADAIITYINRKNQIVFSLIHYGHLYVLIYILKKAKAIPKKIFQSCQ